MPIGGSAKTLRCWVPGCINSNIGNKLSSTKLFKFPAGNLARSRQWLKVVGSKALLSCRPDQLKNKAVCEAHFRDYEIQRHNIRTTVVTTAIPSQLLSGVSPLPDELVEQWPLQKENQSGGELDSTVCQPKQPMAMSTLGPLKERETNVTRQVLSAGVQTGPAPQLPSFESDSGTKAPVELHFEDDTSDDDWELMDLVLYRRKKDSRVCALPATVRVHSRPKVLLVQ